MRDLQWLVSSGFLCFSLQWPAPRCVCTPWIWNACTLPINIPVYMLHSRRISDWRCRLQNFPSSSQPQILTCCVTAVVYLLNCNINTVQEAALFTYIHAEIRLCHLADELQMKCKKSSRSHSLILSMLFKSVLQHWNWELKIYNNFIYLIMNLVKLTL